MKTAVVYYSLEGNCALIAEWIKARLDADLIPLETVDEKKRTGLAKYAWGGIQVMMNKKPPLKPYRFDAAAYDLIILGTPVWAASPAPPLQTFIAETKISGKRIALFCCHRNGKGQAQEKLRALLPGNTITEEIDFIHPSTGNHEEIQHRLDAWIADIKKHGE